MRHLIAAVLICLAPSPMLVQSALAQELVTYPKSLAGFLKSGTHVGIYSNVESGSHKVTIYSEEDFEIAMDARNMDLEELALKYKSVAQDRDRELKRFTASLESKRKTLAANKEFGEPKARITINPRELLYTVAYVGDDYILVSPEANPKKFTAFSTRFLSTIRWHEGFRYGVSVRHVDRVSSN